MEQTRTEAPIGARPGSPSPLGPVPAAPVPAPAVPAPVDVDPPGLPPEVGAARGEHVLEDDPDVTTATLRRLPRRHSVRGQVLAALRRALATGDLVPGHVYSAPALAERHGVSPTPVREAMQQLACEGLVETVPNRGFRVVLHSARDAAELAEIRLLLELPVVLRLAGTQPLGTWEALSPLAERTVAAAARGDRAAYAEADRAFHGALLEPAGNRRLVEFAEEVQRRVPAPATPAGVPTPGLVSAAAEHVALVEALSARDLAGAERILRGHLAPGPPLSP
jgi:DNA-binding GntR family transcriptional regulator